MKIGVIGHRGMVGSRLVEWGYTPIDVDVTNQEDMQGKMSDFDCIIYCAGFTDVDACEKDKYRALRINVMGINKLLRVYKRKLVYISSDHVFDGKKNWLGKGYSEKHTPHPLNHYGLTKLSGELLVRTHYKYNFDTKEDIPMGKVIRTSKLFDREYVDRELQKSEVTDKLTRTFLHVDHFVHGLTWVVDRWDIIPNLLNISGTANLTHYMFLSACAQHLGVDAPEPRKKLLKDVTPRPIRGGLNVNLAEDLGVPLYSAYDGVKLL